MDKETRGWLYLLSAIEALNTAFCCIILFKNYIFATILILAFVVMVILGGKLMGESRMENKRSGK